MKSFLSNILLGKGAFKDSWKNKLESSSTSLTRSEKQFIKNSDNHYKLYDPETDTVYTFSSQSPENLRRKWQAITMENDSIFNKFDRYYKPVSKDKNLAGDKRDQYMDTRGYQVDKVDVNMEKRIEDPKILSNYEEMQLSIRKVIADAKNNGIKPHVINESVNDNSKKHDHQLESIESGISQHMEEIKNSKHKGLNSNSLFKKGFKINDD
jgi:hypothetical protein